MDAVPPDTGDPPSSGSARGMGDPDFRRSRRIRRVRRLWRTIPSPPRCKLCTRPFGAPGGPIMRLFGLGPWPGNPTYCTGCFRDLYRYREGGEIECTLLFADIRGSTRLAESMSPREFGGVMERFYATAAEVLVEHEAIVDKFVGDEVVAIFVPAMTDGRHARQAVDAGIGLLRATGHEGGRPWAPVGIGVNTGRAYVGAVGTAEHVEFTALGDAVNVAARLASVAVAGELLVSEAAARAAAWGSGDGDVVAAARRRVDLRGKSVPTEVLVLRLGSELADQRGEAPPRA
jgi:adenylate cyclase